MQALHQKSGLFTRSMRVPSPTVAPLHFVSQRCHRHACAVTSDTDVVATTASSEERTEPPQASTSAPEAPAAPVASPEEDDENTIYLGFQKGDYDRSAGRKGRTIKDDKVKYPEKDSIGPFLFVTGGWAGGEAGLKKMLAEEEEKAKAGKSAPKAKAAPAPVAASPPPKAAPGTEAVYYGYEKTAEAIAARNAGAKGKVVAVPKDELRYLPGKDDLGPFLGATGGFAGGEAGLKSYIANGELKLRDPKDMYGARKQFSIISLVGLVAVAGVVGGVALTAGFDEGEKLVLEEVQAVNSFALDDGTKTLLLSAVGIIVAAGVVAAGRGVKAAMQDSLRERLEAVNRIAVTTAFGVVVFLAARAVLEL